MFYTYFLIVYHYKFGGGAKTGTKCNPTTEQLPKVKVFKLVFNRTATWSNIVVCMVSIYFYYVYLLDSKCFLLFTFL